MWGYRNACYKALQAAEQQKGGPVYLVEIIRAWNSMIPWTTPFFVFAGLQELYKADEILGNKMLELFTLNPANQSTADNPTDFMLFSDRIAQLYPSFLLDERCRVRPGPQTPVVSFTQLTDLLLSTDLSRECELDWISSSNLRFLDG